MIPELSAGDKAENTVLNAAWMNQLIKAINRLETMTVTPEGVGTFEASTENIVLKLNVDACDVVPPP